MDLHVLSPGIVIEGVHFTVREIDVLSGLVNGRSAKAIALSLNITPRTAETHIRNIMLKLGCNSKEQVLDFIEKSEYRYDLLQHYQDLLGNTALEKILKKASQRQQDTEKSCLVFCWFQHDFPVKFCRFAEHLKLAGLEVTLLKEIPQNLNFENSNIILLTDPQQLPDFLSKLSEKGRKSVFTVDVEDSYCKTILEILETFYPYKITKEEEKSVQSYLIKNPSASFCSQRRLLKTFSIFFRKRTLVLMVSIFLLCLGGLFLKFKGSDSIFRQDLQTISEEHFLKRSQLIRKMNEILNKQSGIQAIALVGPGGSGKTTLARYYARQQKTRVVFEINAENQNSQIECLFELAYCLSDNSRRFKEEIQSIQAMPNFLEKRKQLIALIENKLKSEGKWCLLFDNVEQFQDIRDVFPSDEQVWGRGKVVITTRNKNIQNVAQITPSRILYMEELNRNDRFVLFNKICHDKSQPKDAKNQIESFLEKLPSFPLDISAAAHYVKNTNISFNAYLETLDRVDLQFDQMQKQVLKENLGYSKTRYNIIVTTFQKILVNYPEFKEIFLYLFLLSFQNISKDLLYLCADRISVDSCVYELKKHSLVSETNNNISIHRSIQSIGLSFILNLLNEQEKESYIKNIVNALTPYDQMCWFMYKTDLMGHRETFMRQLIPHLKVLKKNVKKISHQKDRHIVRILAALGHIHHSGGNNIIQSERYYKKVLDYKNCSQYLSSYDLCVLFLNLGYDYILIGNTKQANYCLDKGFFRVKTLKDNEALLSMSFMMRGLLLLREGDFKEAKKHTKEALNLVKRENAPWALSILSEIYSLLSVIHRERYFTKAKESRILSYVFKVLEIYGARDLFYKTKRDLPREFPFMVSLARQDLASFYNLKGYFEKALDEGVKELEYIYHQYPNHLFITQELFILMEKGYSLFGLGQNKKAEEILSYVVAAFKKMKMTKRAVLASTYRIVPRIKLMQLNKGYDDCLGVLSFQNLGKSNECMFLHDQCHYHAALIKYLQKNYGLALQHFSNFFKSMDTFCKGFLKEEEYNELVQNKAFNPIQDPQQISKCFDQSLLIVTAIYGSQHSFVKNYVAKKGNLYSWWKKVFISFRS